MIAVELRSKRYGIATCRTGGCVVDYTGEAGWIGYNDVMSAEITRRFGPDALEAVEIDARKLFDQRRDRGELPWQIAANNRRIVPPDDVLPRWKD